MTLAFAPLDAAALSRWPAQRPLFHLQLHGAGHVGRADRDAAGDARRRRRLVRRARRRLSRRNDARLAVALAHPPHVESTPSSARSRTHRRAPSTSSSPTSTRSTCASSRPILRRGDFAFCGLIGSKTKRATLRAPARGARRRGGRDRAPDLPDRRRRHRRQGAGGHRRRRSGRIAARDERDGDADRVVGRRRLVASARALTPNPAAIRAAAR